KPGALVVPQGLRVVEPARVHPEPRQRPLPCAVDRRAQQEGAKAAPDKFRDEPKIAQFALLRRRRVQLEVAGRYTTDMEDKDLGRGLVDFGGERVVAKQPALVPQPR